MYRQRRAPASTGADLWRRWLAEFGPEAVQIRLTGGEPTLHPQFFQILKAATSYDAWVTVFTNGRWRQPEDLVRQLAGWPRLSGLLVSLHGASPEAHEAFSGVPGSFAETVANIRLAIAAGVRVALSTIITRHSWREVSAIVELGRQLGVQHVAFNRYLGAPDDRIEPTVSQFRAAVQKIESLIATGEPVKYGIGLPQCFCENSSDGCLAGAAYVAIDPWGRVHPCAHSPSFVGSLREHSLFDLWHGPGMQKWRALMPSECTSCAAYVRCHGGCRAVQEVRPDRRDPLRFASLANFAPPISACALPAHAHPRAKLRLRVESFGYVALGGGQLMPVHTAARPLLEACDGSASFAELVERFGDPGLNLLGELWQAGMLQLDEELNGPRNCAA